MADYKQLLERAARLCSTGEKCSSDIGEKLHTWGMDEKDVEKALAYLISNKFIDDQRYTTFFVRDKLKLNKWGRIKIGYALRQKKIDPDIIKVAMEEIDENLYLEILDGLIADKIRKAGPPSDFQDKAKILRFAAQRGFTQEEVWEAMGRVGD